VAKRKPVEVIKVDGKSRQVKIEQPPPCYNRKEPYCRPDLCGEWFGTCQTEEHDDHSG